MFHYGDAPKGWKRIIDPLITDCETFEIEIYQIKEKFGGLRFYTGSAPRWFKDKVDRAERQSFRTCQDCGEHAIVRQIASNDVYYVATLCDKHLEKRDEY